MAVTSVMSLQKSGTPHPAQLKMIHVNAVLTLENFDPGLHPNICDKTEVNLHYYEQNKLPSDGQHITIHTCQTLTSIAAIFPFMN